MKSTERTNGAPCQDDAYVHEVPGVCGGYPVIRDTRMAVSLIVELTREGATIEQLSEWYPHVSPAALRGALDFYARCPERVDDDLARQQHAWSSFVEENVPNHNDVATVPTVHRSNSRRSIR